MFYAVIGLPTLRVLAIMGVQWAMKKIADSTKDEPSQADDNYVNETTKDV